MKHATRYKTVLVDDLEILYREAGPPTAPSILLLHGFPSSSRMYQPLLDRLSDDFHLVAPDYPGFGHSDAPSPDRFAYTFDHIAAVMERFTAAIGLARYSLYMQHYGGPVGFRIALKNPQCLQALIIQNAVAHNQGLGPLWEVRRAFWRDRSKHQDSLRRNFLSLETTRSRHVGKDPETSRYDPDLWVDEQAFLARPGQDQIQLDLFYDYRTNVEAYFARQQWLQTDQPRLLVLWGRYDTSFEAAAAEAYRSDVPSAEVHYLDAGHFALDTQADTIAGLMRSFYRALNVENARSATKQS